MFMCSALGAGRRLCGNKGCLVTETIQEWAYVCLASFVCEILLAKRAIPALKIASFGAGGRFGGKVLQVMFAISREGLIRWCHARREHIR